MKTTMRGLTLAAIVLSASSAMADSNDSRYFDNEQDAIPSAVGDLPGYGDDAYFAESASYAEASRTVSRTNYAASAPSARPASKQALSANSGNYQSVSYDMLQPNSYVEHAGQYGAGCGVESGWSGGCDGGSSCDCGSCGGGGGRLGRMMRGQGNGTWAQAEALLWFPQARTSPILVSRAAAGANPALNQQGTGVFGGSNSLGGDLSGGFRGDFGKFIAPNVGFGGRFWILGDNDEDFAAQGTAATTSLGIPIFNTSTVIPGVAGENSIVIAGVTPTVPGPSTFTGEVVANSSLEMFAAEAYGRLRFASGNGYSLDFIGGYTHVEIDDSLALFSRRINTTIPPNASTGRVDTFFDQFDTENKFNGGQLGFESVLTRGRWMARSLTKVHLGNMNQRLTTAGNTTQQSPPANPDVFPGGIFTEGNAAIERDVFAFSPEVNFKLAYRFRPNVLLSAGYSFIYWDHVGLAGAQVNRNVNAANLFNAAAGPAPTSIVDSSLYVHGLDLGVILDF